VFLKSCGWLATCMALGSLSGPVTLSLFAAFLGEHTALKHHTYPGSLMSQEGTTVISLNLLLLLFLRLPLLLPT
jgi:hypothetical protein